MKLKKLLFLLVVCWTCSYVYAQELTVKEMKATNDLSASQYRRKDLTGEACALVKVQLATADVGFEGNVIQPVEYKGGEYWVYMTKGSRELRIKHLAKSPVFVPCHVSFGDYGITGLESLATYNLTLLLPQGAAIIQTQKLTINYTPATAMVIIDSKVYRGNGRIDLNLQIGDHYYVIAEDGYVSAEGSVKLSSDAPRIITENLVATQSSTQHPIQNAVKEKDNQKKITSKNAEIDGRTPAEIGELAKDYLNGTGGKTKDYVKALNYAHIAVEGGDVDAMNGIGIIYDNGYGVKRDYAEAARWYRKAAELGNARGQNNLGCMYRDGTGVEKDYKEAIKWYQKAAEQGYDKAQHNLGWMYDNGFGVKQDYAEAVKWYQKAAEQGYDKAQHNLGWMYREGYGVKQDYVEALKWYRKSAEQGNAGSVNDVGYMYSKGWGVEQDYVEAVKWYRRAAELGDDWGQNNLGCMYRDGKGVEKDDVEAVKWFKKAAEQGHAVGELNLAGMYYNGYGVKQDYTEAAKWYRKAAEQENSIAQYNLGLCYQYGRGVNSDLSQAKFWYEKAAAHGYDNAKKKINELK